MMKMRKSKMPRYRLTRQDWDDISDSLEEDSIGVIVQ